MSVFIAITDSILRNSSSFSPLYDYFSVWLYLFFRERITCSRLPVARFPAEKETESIRHSARVAMQSVRLLLSLKSATVGQTCSKPKRKKCPYMLCRKNNEMWTEKFFGFHCNGNPWKRVSLSRARLSSSYPPMDARWHSWRLRRMMIARYP